MMSIKENLYFLSGGGEMGELVRAKDWSKTSLGVPENWPQSLRSTLSIILNSRFPMFLFWGEEHICFYNDAYRPSLGKEGKHPEMLGGRGEDYWAEIWPVIKPLIDQVMSGGEASWNEDQLIPIYRNGRLEDVYWTFSYSPVLDESGKPGGVFVTCSETTSKILSIQQSLEDSRRFRAYIADVNNAQERLKESTEKLNIVINASDLGIWELNLKTRAVAYSDRYMEILGLEKGKEYSHQDLLQRIHPDDLHKRERAITEAIKNGVLNFESRLIWPDGSIHWMEGKGKMFYDEEGLPERMMGTIRDITQEKNHEDELIESERRFRTMAEALPHLVWETDASGNALYTSQRWDEYIGMKPIGENEWRAIIHPDDFDYNTRVWKESLETGNIYRCDVRLKSKSGEYRWHTVIGEPVRDAAQRIVKWVGAFTDIHVEKEFTNLLEIQVEDRTRELYELNENLRASEERYHLMVEEVQDYAILYLDPQGIVENWNNGAEKIKGYKAEEIIGKSFSIFYPDEDYKSGLPQKLLGLAANNGKAIQEGWRIRKDGSKFWASVVITAIHNDAGAVIGYSKMTHDLTEKKLAEDRLKANSIELIHKNQALERMNKELESFAYISSHDLQEPLRKIQTFASRILDKEYNALSESAKDSFQRMYKAANRMQTLIEDLLAYSRTSTVEVNFKETPIIEIIDQVREDMRESLLQRHALVRVNAAGSADIVPFQLRQLLQNLLSNSLKFSSELRSPVIDIVGEITSGKDLDNPRLIGNIEYYHLAVKDNGIGFSSEYNEKIFEVFQRLHGKEEYSGTGIGLAIVKKIVDNHEGLIYTFGYPDLGAEFHIYLPVKRRQK